MRRTVAIILGLVLLLGIVGISANIPKDTLVMAMNTGIFITFDPAVAYEVPPDVFVSNIYSSLYKLEVVNGTIKPVPEVAESYDLSKDGTVWTFHIRHGLVFANGDPLTADSVVYSIKRVLKLSKSPVWLFNSIGLTAENMEQTVEKIDDYTVVITTDKPYAPNTVLSILSEGWGGVLDEKVVQSHETNGDMGSAWLTDHSAGSGPYVLQSWQRNSRIVLTANPKYWRGEPQMKTIITVDTPEAANQLLLVKKGDADVAWNLTPEQANSLKGNSEFYVASVPGQSDEYVGMNAGWGPFKDVRVRQAVKYAIDYNSIINDIRGGYAINVQGFIPYGYFGYVSDTPFSQNIEKAKKLMADAGYADGFEVDLVTNDTYTRRSEAVALQADLAKIGIKANITVMQASQMYTKFRQQGINMIVAGWGIDYPDANALSMPFANYRVNQLAWRLMWYDDYAADLAEEAAFETNADKREQMYADLTKYWFMNGPFAMLYQPKDYWGVRSEVKGYEDAAMGYSLMFDFTKISK